MGWIVEKNLDQQPSNDVYQLQKLWVCVGYYLKGEYQLKSWQGDAKNWGNFVFYIWRIEGRIWQQI